MRSCLINHKARNLLCLISWKEKTRQRFLLLCLEKFSSRCWNVFDETKALTWLQILFVKLFFYFPSEALSSLSRCLKSFLHFKYFSIFLWLSKALSVFCASFQTSSVKCHFKRLVARRKCKVPCDNWNEFVQIKIRRTLTVLCRVIVVGNGTIINKPELWTLLYLPVWIFVCAVPLPFKLKAFPVCVIPPLACFKFFGLWHSLWLRVFGFWHSKMKLIINISFD